MYVFTWAVSDFLQTKPTTTLQVLSFTDEVAPSFLLACIAILGLFLLYVVIKNAFTDHTHVNSRVDQDFDEDSCDEVSSHD